MIGETARWFVFVVVLWVATFTGLLNGRLRVWSTARGFSMANEYPCPGAVKDALPHAECYGWVADWRGI